MKKILCLFSAFTLVLISSCSSDDSSSESNDDLVLLKKTITTDSDGNKVTTNYKFNGNKIVSTIDDSGELELYYTYTGDLITKLEYKFPDGSLDQINLFTYNSEGKLATAVRIDPEMEWGNKEVFTYNEDGSVSVIEYIGDDETQTQENATRTIKFLAGEVSEITSTNSPNHKYVYDTKNNPLKNVLGFDKIAFIDAEADGVLHNTISDTSEGEVLYNYVFTYNSNGYPVKSDEIDDGETSSTEYFY